MKLFSVTINQSLLMYLAIIQFLDLYNESVKEAKYSYFNDLINCHNNNAMLFFQIINSIVCPPTQPSDHDCNTFLNHFVNKLMDLRSKTSSNGSRHEDDP